MVPASCSTECAPQAVTVSSSSPASPATSATYGVVSNKLASHNDDNERGAPLDNSSVDGVPFSVAPTLGPTAGALDDSTPWLEPVPPRPPDPWSLSSGAWSGSRPQASLTVQQAVNTFLWCNGAEEVTAYMRSDEVPPQDEVQQQPWPPPKLEVMQILVPTETGNESLKAATACSTSVDSVQATVGKVEQESAMLEETSDADMKHEGHRLASYVPSEIVEVREAVIKPSDGSESYKILSVSAHNDQLHDSVEDRVQVVQNLILQEYVDGHIESGSLDLAVLQKLVGIPAHITNVGEKCIDSFTGEATDALVEENSIGDGYLDQDGITKRSAELFQWLANNHGGSDISTMKNLHIVNKLFFWVLMDLDGAANQHWTIQWDPGGCPTELQWSSGWCDTSYGEYCSALSFALRTSSIILQGHYKYDMANLVNIFPIGLKSLNDMEIFWNSSLDQNNAHLNCYTLTYVFATTRSCSGYELLELAADLYVEETIVNKVFSGMLSADEHQLSACLSAEHPIQIQAVPLQTKCSDLHVLIHAQIKQNKFSAAEKLGDLMLEEKISPNVVTYSTMIDGLCQNGATSLALEMFNRMVEHSCLPNLHTYSSLIQALGQEGKVEEAEELFSDLVTQGLTPDEVTYIKMMEVYILSGKIDCAFDVLGTMINAGCQPTLWTYDVLIIGLKNEYLMVNQEVVVLPDAVSDCSFDGQVINKDAISVLSSKLAELDVGLSQQLYRSMVGQGYVQTKEVHMPWDPGKSSFKHTTSKFRLGDKPSFKEGGMLGAYLYSYR